ncbi:MAG: phosphoserine aminotransferase, partial [Pseudomonadota bacterium]
MKPETKPQNPKFGSGPTAKRPNWNLDCLSLAELGRSHRSAAAKAQLHEVIARSRSLLQIPNNFRVGIVPASDTGAFEMAMWSMLGERAVDVLEWESFGKGWLTDVVEQLQLARVRTFSSDYGSLPDLTAICS